MPLTDSSVEVAAYLHALITAQAVPLGLEAVYYGDQNKIPACPAVVVEPSRKRREPEGFPRMTRMTLQVVVLVYLFRVENAQVERKDADLLAEDVETLLHQDSQCGGLVIQSHCPEIEFGYAFRGTSLLRTARIIFEADSKVRLPQS